MLHHRLTVSDTTMPVHPDPGEYSKEYLLILLLYSVERDLQTVPRLYEIGREGKLWALFENACLDGDEFLCQYGDLLCWISERYPLSLYGTLDSGESAKIEIRPGEEGKSARVWKKNISGQEFSALSDFSLCLRVEDPGERRVLREALQALSPWQHALAVRRTPLTDRWFAGCPDLDGGGVYRYLPLADGAQDCFWDGLSLEQQKKLWELLLVDGVSAGEFDTILDRFGDQGLCHSLKWELSLRMALDEAGYTISNEEEFRILDASGRRVWFDYNTGTGAQRMLLKTLFPVAPEKH